MDGELADEDAGRVRYHLSKCIQCEMEYAELRESALLVTSHARALDPAPELWSRLQSRITEMPAPGASQGFFRFLSINRWTAALATLTASVVLAFGLWSYYQYRQSQDDLESALRDYVASRTVAEQIHRIQFRQVMRIPSGRETFGRHLFENPFADVRPVSYTNPFTPEDR